MKLLSVLFLVLIFVSSCSKEQHLDEADPAGQLNLDEITISASMKGWELYSWPNETQWNYSILIGTNRTKSLSEVTSNELIAIGEGSLKQLLNKFPEGEQIFWIDEEWLNSCWGGNEHGSLSLPPTLIITEIKDYCDQKGLILDVIPICIHL